MNRGTVTEPPDPTQPDDGELAAQEAYRAYGEVVGWRNYQDLPMPAWEGLTPAIREAWAAAVTAGHAALARIAETRNPARVAAVPPREAGQPVPPEEEQPA